MMLGLNYENINPTGHSNPAIFFETKGNTREGSLGQKSNGHLEKQNYLGLKAFSMDLQQMKSKRSIQTAGRRFRLIHWRATRRIQESSLQATKKEKSSRRNVPVPFWSFCSYSKYNDIFTILFIHFESKPAILQKLLLTLNITHEKFFSLVPHGRSFYCEFFVKNITQSSFIFFL